MKSIFLIFATILILTTHSAHAQDDFDWREIDRAGTLIDKNLRVADNLWKNYTQAQAVAIIKRIPNITKSPAYTELARRFLLTSDTVSNESIDAPLLLAARLEKLIALGLINDAEALLNSVKHPDNYELAQIKTQQKLLTDSLSSVCLDIQASSMNYRDMPAWRELGDFCKLRFDSGEKIKMGSMAFNNFPDLQKLLSQPDQIKLQNLNDNFSTFIAFNDGIITDEVYNRDARQLDSVTNLSIKIATKQEYAKQETYSCYIIEAANRGLITEETIEAAYKGKEFSETQLSNTSGRINLHPCDIPAYFYQRLNKNAGQDNINQFIDIAVRSGGKIPAQAFIPFRDIFQSYKGDDDYTKWRIANILGANGNQIPSSWTVTKPLIALQKNESLNQNEYLEWLKSRNNDFLSSIGINDPAEILYFSQALNSNKGNFKLNLDKYDYENLFSLTYGKKSLVLGLGFNDYIESQYENNNHTNVITSILYVAGKSDVRDLSPNDLGVIISGLKAYKLEKNAISLVLEYLQ